MSSVKVSNTIKFVPRQVQMARSSDGAADPPQTEAPTEAEMQPRPYQVTSRVVYLIKKSY